MLKRKHKIRDLDESNIERKRRLKLRDKGAVKQQPFEICKNELSRETPSRTDISQGLVAQGVIEIESGSS